MPRHIRGHLDPDGGAARATSIAASSSSASARSRAARSVPRLPPVARPAADRAPPGACPPQPAVGSGPRRAALAPGPAPRPSRLADASAVSASRRVMRLVEIGRDAVLTGLQGFADPRQRPATEQVIEDGEADDQPEDLLEKVDTSSCGMARAPRPDRRRGGSIGAARRPGDSAEQNHERDQRANRPIASTSAKPIHIRPATRF